MKKTFPTSLLMLLFVLSIISCQTNDQSTTLTPEQIAANWKKTVGKISHEEANELEESYKKLLYNGSRDSLITAAGDVYADAREVWFDLEELKNYINYVEQYGKDKNYDHLGMRVYLGSNGLQENGGARTTVFFYGTGRFASVKKLQDGDGTLVEPNLPGADGLNRGNSGMPPNDLKYP